MRKIFYLSILFLLSSIQGAIDYSTGLRYKEDQYDWGYRWYGKDFSIKVTSNYRYSYFYDLEKDCLTATFKAIYSGSQIDINIEKSNFYADDIKKYKKRCLKQGEKLIEEGDREIDSVVAKEFVFSHDGYLKLGIVFVRNGKLYILEYKNAENEFYFEYDRCIGMIIRSWKFNAQKYSECK